MVAFLAFLALTLAAGRAWAALPAEQPYRIDYHGRLVTDVYVNGQGPFQFLIDTASSRSLIFEHVRRQLNLTQSQPGRMTVYGINDVADVMPVKPHELQVAGETIPDLLMGVLPDSEADDPDGILGVDVLSHYFVVLDRGTMRLKLLPPADTSAAAYRDWSEVELMPRPLKKFPIQFWYLRARFNDRDITSLFDLGASMTMLNWGAAEQLGVHKSRFRSYGPPPALLQDVLGKEAPAVRADGLEVRLPGKTWFKQSAMIADAPVFSYFDLEEKPSAIVGLDLLRNNSLAIDFAGHRLYLGPTISRTAEEEKQGKRAAGEAAPCIIDSPESACLSRFMR
jgi:predicted aspartyl protease